jgi:sec-independent protein translocase protein TatC
MAASDVTSDPRVRQGIPAGPAGPAAAAADDDEEPEGATMTLVEHLEELRKRIFLSLLAVAVCSVAAFFFWEPILRFLETPLPAISSKLTDGRALVATGIGEPFMVALELAIAVGICVASPMVLYQVWAFISPALTRKERKYALPFTLLGVGLFVVGIAVGFVVLRYPVAWLIDFGKDQFTLLLKASEYFTFVAYFLLAFGLVFELPLLLTFLGVVGVLRSATLRRRRMYILFGLWFASCFITPGADPYSPVIIGVAFTILFELSIILLRILKK